MKGYHLKLIRHGWTEENTKLRYIGITDNALSQKGKDELFQKKDKFDYDSVQKVYCSPLKRCVETAEILYPNNFIHVVEGLREMDFGDFENKSAEDLMDNKSFQEWLKGGIDNAPPNGESTRNTLERSYEAFDVILKDMMENGFTNCAVVTHGGIIMNSLACFGLPKYKPMDLAPEVGEGFELMVTTQMWQQSNAFEILGRFPYNKIDEDKINSERFDSDEY